MGKNVFTAKWITVCKQFMVCLNCECFGSDYGVCEQVLAFLTLGSPTYRAGVSNIRPVG